MAVAVALGPEAGLVLGSPLGPTVVTTDALAIGAAGRLDGLASATREVGAAARWLGAVAALA